MAVRLLAPRSVLNVLTAPLTPTIPGIYVEQDTIETADNSNYIGPKTINELHLIMELYIIIRLYFTKPRGQRFFFTKIQEEYVLMLFMCTRYCQQPSMAWLSGKD